MARPGWRARLVLAWRYISRFEPARLMATWRALLGVAIVVGVTVPAEVDGRVTAILAAATTLLTVLQGELTRARVVPEHRVRALVREAKDQPPPM